MSCAFCVYSIYRLTFGEIKDPIKFFNQNCDKFNKQLHGEQMMLNDVDGEQNGSND